MKRFFCLFFMLFCVGMYAQNNAYVTNNGDSTVSVIDLTTNTAIATVTVGIFPEGISVTPDGGFAYVVGLDTDISVIDTSTNTVVATVIGVNQKHEIVFSSNGTKGYTANQSASNVSIIDVATNTISGTIQLALTVSAFGLDITPDGKFLYVADQTGDFVRIADLSTNLPSGTVDVGDGQRDVVITPDGNKGYAGLVNGGVAVFNVLTNTLITTIATGTETNNVGITPDGEKVFASNTLENNVSVIDTATDTVIATITVGMGPRGSLFNTAGIGYVTNSGSGNVSIIDVATNAVTGTITVGTTPYALAFNLTDLTVSGEATSNKFLTQKDLVNVVHWVLPVASATFFEVFRDGVLIATIAGDKTEYVDHNRPKNETVTYTVTGGGATGTVTITR